MWEIAEPPDGPYIQRFSDLARELSIVLCFGYAERRDDGVYNAAIILGPDGEHCGTYYKTQLAEGACDDWDFNRLGHSLRAIDTPVGRVGTMICNDRWNPLIARAQVMDGAQALLIPSFGSRSREQNLNVIARARENGVPVVEANVGVNLIVSKGEVAAYVWGTDRISIATIEVPLPPSDVNARAVAEEFMTWRGPEMQRRYERTVEKISS
jgi:predicted amidohydrolase